jgi:peptide/nickel transport system ATP-binding protein
MTVAPPHAPQALELEDLEVAYRVRGLWRPVLRGVTLHIAEGEAYGLVGESGCGKSTAAFAALRYLPRNGRVTRGAIRVGGQDLLAMTDADVRRMRSTKLSMVYQNPTSALNRPCASAIRSARSSRSREWGATRPPNAPV